MSFRFVAFALVPAALALAPAAAAQSTDGGATTTSTATATATAPATATSPAPATATDTSVRRAVYISLDFGFTRADVGALSNNTSFDKTGANGFLAGVGLGYRYRNLRIGGRFRDTSTTEFNLWSLMGEVGYGLPFKPITPVIFVHAGYMFDSGIQRSVVASALPKGNVLTPNLGLDGAVLGAELLGNLHLTDFLRLGPFIGFDLTWLHRKQVGLPQSIVPLTSDTTNNPLYTGSGSGVGYVFNIGIRGTGDIAF